MNRRQLSVAALVAALWPFAARTGDTLAQATCEAVPPFIRQGDPIQALFTADLHHWAMTNLHIPYAQVFVHPQLAYLVPPQGKTVQGETQMAVSVQPAMPVPWAIVPECG